MNMAMMTHGGAKNNSNGYDEVPTTEKQAEEGDLVKKEKCSPMTTINNFKPIIFLFILILYSLIGGWIFYSIENETALRMFEYDVEKNEKLRLQIAMYISSLVDIDTFFVAGNDTETNGTMYRLINNGTDVDRSLIPFDELMTALSQYAKELIRQDARDIGDWSFWGSVFYAGTVYTTIGYGNIIPHTIQGRVATMFYALIGIPLMLFTLAQLGKMFCSLLLRLYLYCSYFFCRCASLDPKKKVDVVVDFPLSVAFAMAFAWMCMCSGLFCLWENWSFITSFYFFFQSLTTIGLGDVTPDHTERMLSSFLLIVSGMSLVSMCLNLVQLKMDRFINDMIRKIQTRYLQLELKGEDMKKDGKEVQTEISKMLSAQSVFLKAVMTDVAKERLVGEWQKKAALCNVGVQATVRMKDVGVSFLPKTKEEGTQSLPLVFPKNGPIPGVNNASFQTMAPVHFEVPYRETRKIAGPVGNDEFRTKLKELGSILNECNSLVKDLH